MTKHIFTIFISVFIFKFSFGQIKVDTFVVRNLQYWESKKPLKDGYYKFKKGKITIEKGLIQDDCPNGLWHYYYPNGKLKCVNEWKQIGSKLVRIGDYICYYLNGKTQESGTNSEYTNDSIRCHGCYEYDYRLT